jgi:hypothetical protein
MKVEKNKKTLAKMNTNATRTMRVAAGRVASSRSIAMFRGQPGPALFKAFFLSEKWSHKHHSDSIFLTSLPPFPSSMSLSHSLWLRLAALGNLSFFAANQLKFLSLSMLHKNAGFFNQGKSSPIKPN